MRCPEDTPILIEGESECSACPEGTLFDQDGETCKKLEDFCESNRVVNVQTRKCECPKEKPFDNGNECVTCYLPRYWNHDTKSCENCALNHVYSTTSKKCERCPEDNPVLLEGDFQCSACPKDTLFDRES